jgi:uncharacterized membrane protein
MVRYPAMLFFALLLGVAAGLRSMTPLAVTAWAARSWVPLHDSALSFLAAPVTAYILTALAIGELIADKLPFIPSRLTIGPLGARLVSGAICGGALTVAAGQSLPMGAIVGAIGGLAGSFGGYQARRAGTASKVLPPVGVALIEDAIAIGLSILAVSRV